MRKSILQNLCWVLLLLLPVIFIFKALFLSGPGVWGDAPYFYSQGLKELVSEPYSWTNRGNNFGGVNQFLWLAPIMFVYGLLSHFFGLGNDLIIRILFYFPSIILAILAPILLTRYLKFSKTVQYFSALIFSLNTYFLLLIDGGQVGVSLAYGLFPLTLLFLRKLIDKPNFKGFFFSLLFLLLIFMADPRIGLVAVLTFVFWMIIEAIVFKKKAVVVNLKLLVLLAMVLVGLSAYWLVPLFKIGEQSLNLGVSGLEFISLLNPLLLFQPHWPLNEFGRVFSPPFYFIVLPFLIFASLLFKKNRKPLVLAICFLLIAFLVKGTAPPLGNGYAWLIENVPFGFAFRDSSKFFTPLILFASILIGMTLEKFKSKFFSLLVYVYLLFLLYPALLGDLNGVLAIRSLPKDFKIIQEQMARDEGFFRTAWFPEKHPFSFQTSEKPALDAKNLVGEWPFAVMNTGSFDRFNFMHNREFLEWFDLLGIKYLVFSGDPRTVQLAEEEEKLWHDLLGRVATTSGLVKVDWEIDSPVYGLAETRPRIFGVDKLFAVVGSSVGVLPSVYFEDGRLDPKNLEGIASESAVLVFNNKDEEDLSMSFLQDYFLGSDKAKNSDWAFYEPDDYLEWKYQLLIRDIDCQEFDYGQGISFSSQPNEKLTFNFKTKEKGEYILAIRNMASSESGNLKIDFNGEQGEIGRKRLNGFEWFIKPLFLEKGNHQLVLENQGGLQVVNTLALIPKSDFVEAQILTETFVLHFGKRGIEGLELEVNQSKWQKVDYQKISPVRYKVKFPKDSHWLVFTDSFHPLWLIKRDQLVYKSLPFYSIVNGFYQRPEWDSAELVFEGQKEVRWGIYFTAISILSLVIIFLWFCPTWQKGGKV